MTTATILAQLLQLPIQPAAPHAGYRREQFGARWSDVDRNRCNTRDDILARDLVDVRRDGACTVLDGLLVDPYTGRTVVFVRGPSSAAVQVDHVVALSWAWDTGAQAWSPRRRVEFANDPDNLLAVDGPTNREKSDHDPSEWLPTDPRGRCLYAARYVTVKHEYGLWVTGAEFEALRGVLSSCDG